MTTVVRFTLFAAAIAPSLFFGLGMEVHERYFGSAQVTFWQDKTPPFEKVTFLEVMLPARFGHQSFQSCQSAMDRVMKHPEPPQ